jgi:hypothetical protein
MFLSVTAIQQGLLPDYFENTPGTPGEVLRRKETSGGTSEEAI